MQSPVEHRGPRARASAAQAAWFLAVCAASIGLVSGLLVALWLLPQQAPSPVAVLQGLVPAISLLAWVLAVAAVLTGVVVRRRDPSDRRARTALRIALPGALAGTVAVVVVIGWLASWSLSP